MKEYRKPAVAGSFYPSDPVKLKDEIDLMLSISQSEFIPSGISGMISPHAGYLYSGKTAAFAYNTIKGKDYKTVIIISLWDIVKTKETLILILTTG